MVAALELSKAERKQLLEARREAWLSGDLRYLLRGYGQPSPMGKFWSQVRMYDWTKAWKEENPDRRGPLILWVRRRAGKSAGSILEHIEDMLKEPDRNQNFIAPFQWQCDDIARPLIEMFLRDAPPDLIYRWRRNTFFIQNPRWKSKKYWNRLFLLGCDSKGGNRLRGLPSACRVTVDEARDIDIFEYLMESLLPHVFTGQKRPLLKIITTPPPSLECALVKRYNARAREDGRVLQIRGSEDASLSDQEIRDILETGDISPTSNAYLREIEAELVQDTSVAVIPDWFAYKHSIIVKHPSDLPLPRFFIPQVQIDAAYSMDKLAILFGYIDHDRGLIRVQDCIIGDHLNTREMLTIALKKEKELWPDPPAPIRRRADMPASQISDLIHDAGIRRDFNLPFGYFITEVEKSRDRWADLQKLRSDIRRIRIDERAKDLIYQLDVGTVKFNREHTKVDFVRTSELGHLDAVAALRDLVKYARIRFPMEQANPPDPYDPNVCFPAGYREPVPTCDLVTHSSILVTHSPANLYRQGRPVR